MGSFIARLSAHNHKECVGVHLNMMMVRDQLDESKLTEIEKKAVESASRWQETGSAYAQEHGTRPSTIGSVLSSSPLALLAWYTLSLLFLSSTRTSCILLTRDPQDWREIPRMVRYRPRAHTHPHQHLPLLVHVQHPHLLRALPRTFWQKRVTSDVYR